MYMCMCVCVGGEGVHAYMYILPSVYSCVCIHAAVDVRMGRDEGRGRREKSEALR